MKEPEINRRSARETIDRIRAKQKVAKNTPNSRTEIPYQEEASPTIIKQGRRRVSNRTKPVDANTRNEARSQIMKSLLMGKISQGEALKALRMDVLGLKQDAFAKLVSVSRKTLSEVENDKGNYTPDIINRVFKPFGLKVGLVPVSVQIFTTLFNRTE